MRKTAQIRCLCYNEISLYPTVVKAKRLSKPITNKVQPLLVTLDSSETARTMLQRAKNLRQSNETTPAAMCSSMRICQRMRQKLHTRYDVRCDWLAKTRKRCLRRMLHHPTRAATPIDNQNQLHASSSSSISHHNSRALNSQFVRTPMQKIDHITSVAESVMVSRDALKEQHTPVANGGRATTQQLSASMLGEFNSSQAIEMDCDIRTTQPPRGSMLRSTSLRGTTPSTPSTSGEKHAPSTSHFKSTGMSKA